MSKGERRRERRRCVADWFRLAAGSVYRKQMGYACSTPYFTEIYCLLFRDDIGPCLPRVTLMSLIAPPVRLPTTTGSRYRQGQNLRGRVSPPLSLLLRFRVVPRFYFRIVAAPILVKLTSLYPISIPTAQQRWPSSRKSPRHALLSPGIYCLLEGGGNDDDPFRITLRTLTRVE